MSDPLSILPPGAKGVPHAAHRRNGEFYVDGRDVFKAPVVAPDGKGGKIISIGFPVCRASPYVGVADLARCLTLGEAAEELLAFATASEIIDRLGPTIEAALEINDAAVAAYREGGKDGLMLWLRELRGKGLATARGSETPAPALRQAQDEGGSTSVRGLAHQASDPQ